MTTDGATGNDWRLGIQDDCKSVRLFQRIRSNLSAEPGLDILSLSLETVAS